MANIRLEKKSRNGRKTDVKVVRTEADAVKHEFDGYVRVVDQPKAAKPSAPSTPAN